jgi:hypothetical protein
MQYTHSVWEDHGHFIGLRLGNWELLMYTGADEPFWKVSRMQRRGCFRGGMHFLRYFSLIRYWPSEVHHAELG